MNLERVMEEIRVGNEIHLEEGARLLMEIGGYGVGHRYHLCCRVRFPMPNSQSQEIPVGQSSSHACFRLGSNRHKTHHPTNQRDNWLKKIIFLAVCNRRCLQHNPPFSCLNFT